MVDSECLLGTLGQGCLWCEALHNLSLLLLLKQWRPLKDLAGASSWWRSLVFFGGLPLFEAPGFLSLLISEELLLALGELTTLGDCCLPKPRDMLTW